MTGNAENYAQALYSLAMDEGLAETVFNQMVTLDTAFSQEPDFLHLLATPNITKEQRLSILDDSFRGKVQVYVLNFLKLLTEAGYIRAFSGCVKAYRRQYYADHGIVSVVAVTAVPLTDGQHEKLRRKLEMVTGKKIELHCRVDPACIGGVRLDYDGKRIDGTVKNHLDSMRRLLLESR